MIGTLRSASTSSAALRALPTAASARLLLKTLDFASATPATYTTLAVELAVVGVRQIDVVVANAGIGRDFASAFSTLATSVRAHLDVNTLGPMQLYQALRGMLVAPAEAEGEGEGGNVKKFVLMSSSLGSIGAMEGAVPSLAYGISKAAANYFVRKVHFEERDLVALAIHPGWVKTENGQCFADSVNVDAPPMEVEESARGVMEQVSVRWKRIMVME